MVVKRIRRREVPVLAPDALDGIHPVLKRVYAARGIRDRRELDDGLGRLLAPDRLSGLDEAVPLLADAVMVGRRIVVVGDFDADGATSSALALRALRAMGAADVHYLVPNRFDYGYGLSPEIVEVAAGLSPSLLITVDNGISCLAGVAAARARGMSVLVTDHHLPGSCLPDADAIVNPNLRGDCFPSKNLAGVGVIFYVLAALRSHLRDRGWFKERGVPAPALADYLDLVAVGTVADVVPLDANNRLLVSQGMRRIRAGKASPGILALLSVAGRDPARLVASDLGFAVGPRLNAAGRLEDMSLGIECLLADDERTARVMAVRLDELNRQRRSIEAQMQEEALAALERVEGTVEDAPEIPRGLCVMDPGWHQGVIGILASRLKDRFHRPTIAFAPGGGDELKGSARSIPGLHMRDALEEVASRRPGVISKFGGHAMAAGLTLPTRNLELFADEFEAVLARRLTEEDLTGVLLSDGLLQPDEFTLDLAEAVRNGGPWGQAFPEPAFDGFFEIQEARIVGEKHLKLTLRPEASTLSLDAIAFNAVDKGWDGYSGRVKALFRLDANEFRGRRRLQLMVEHLDAVGSGVT